MNGTIHRRRYLPLLALLLLVACDMPDDREHGTSAMGVTGDLDEITERGTLRALRPQLAQS